MPVWLLVDPDCRGFEVEHRIGVPKLEHVLFGDVGVAGPKTQKS
jgi:hypothetical protein